MPSPRAARGRAIARSPWSLALLGALVALSGCAASDPSPSSEPPTEPPAETAPQTIERALTLQTPTPGWTLVPQELYRLPSGEYWAIHQLEAPQGMVAQMISSASASFRFEHAGPKEPEVVHHVLGKTWNWNANPEIVFLDARQAIEDALDDAEPIPFTLD